MDRDQFDGACHCRAVRFKVKLHGGLGSARRCDCSFCRMRGAIAVTAKLEEFEIVQGGDRLSLYQFNTAVAKHYFCSTCGIYTHHQRRSNPKEFGVNVACLESVSPFDFDEVIVNDGIGHPLDTGVDRVVGILKYKREPD